MPELPAHDPADLITLFVEIAARIRKALDTLDDWGPAPGHSGQYRHDVVADDIALPMLDQAGLGVLSEESEPVGADRAILAVIDPIDGSTNAALGLPWFATSICAVDADGPLAAVVVNQALGVTYTAVRGEGARRDGLPISPTNCTQLSDAICVLNDLPPRHLGWRQYRVLGAAALDLCAVADGTFDAFADFSAGLSPWDYMGGWLVCTEAGATVVAVGDAPLSTLDPAVRVPLLAAAGPELAAELGAANQPCR